MSSKSLQNIIVEDNFNETKLVENFYNEVEKLGLF